MNIQAQSYMVDTPMAAYGRLIDAMIAHDNEDAIGRDLAVDAICAGRPAYWTTATYHAARCIELCNGVNRGATLETALLGLYPADRAFGRQSALDTLIPLNMAAARELADVCEAL